MGKTPSPLSNCKCKSWFFNPSVLNNPSPGLGLKIAFFLVQFLGGRDVGGGRGQATVGKAQQGISCFPRNAAPSSPEQVQHKYKHAGFQNKLIKCEELRLQGFL